MAKRQQKHKKSGISKITASRAPHAERKHQRLYGSLSAASEPPRRTPKRRTAPMGRATWRAQSKTSIAPTEFIDSVFKGRAIALGPPRDNDPSNLDASFREKLEVVLEDLAAQGNHFRFVEGFRTADRQRWLFGSGAPQGHTLRPRRQNRHGQRRRNDSVEPSRKWTCRLRQSGGLLSTQGWQNSHPPASDAIWRIYADSVVKQGMKAGLNFSTLKDAPHCELS